MSKTIIKYALSTILIIVFLITQNSCKNGPIDPYVNLEPGRRDYSWTADTLFIPFTYMNRIWGSNPNDIWAIGLGDADKTIYHYDGNKWTTDGVSRDIDPTALWGFATDDIWIGGFGPLYHYDGANWNRDFEYNNDDFTLWGIQDIWGDSPDNVWAIGFADSSDVRIGIIFHYDGNYWSRVNIGFTRTTMMRIRRGKKTSNNYFVWGLITSNLYSDTTKLYEFNGKKLKEIFSGLDIRTNYNYIQEIDDEVIFTKGYDLVKYVGNNIFRNIIHINNPKFGVQIFGRTIKDIFIRMKDGIAHFNGNDVGYLIKFGENNNIRDGLIFENKVFFLANNFSTGETIIFKGILQDKNN